MNSDVRKLWRFPGGLKMRPHKRVSTSEPLAQVALPELLTVPVDQHIGEAARPSVRVGERVRRGQVIARGSGIVSAHVHAPTSGTIRAIEEVIVPHPSELPGLAIVLEVDGQDELDDSCRPVADFTALAPAELCRRISEGGIVGLGGASFPTAIKLSATGRSRPNVLVLNGAECEPYISCDEALMQERADQILLGGRIMLHALNAEQCIVATEADKPEAIASLRAAITEQGDERFELVVIEAIYPSGGERQLLQMLSGREVPANGLPIDLGYVCQNVGTAAAVARLIIRGEPLISRIVTVTGNGVARPANLEARLGTPVSQLVEQCGGYTEHVERLIMGGPMMGFALPTDAIPVIKATNCIFAATSSDLRKQDDEMPCIRCGECARVCPASLLPQQLHWHTRAQQFDRVEDFGVFACIECGCCDYVCPSHIPLAQYFRYAKGEIRARRLEREKSEHARHRHEDRERRLAREELARRQKLEARKRAVGATHIGNVEADAIRKVMERVEANKSEAESAPVEMSDDSGDRTPE